MYIYGGENTMDAWDYDTWTIVQKMSTERVMWRCMVNRRERTRFRPSDFKTRSTARRRGGDVTVGHRTQQTWANVRAGLEDICRWMEVDRSNGAGEFRCPSIVQYLTREKVVFWARTKDTRHVFSGIAAPMGNTASPSKAVRN